MPALSLAQVRHARYYQDLLSTLDDHYSEGGGDALSALHRFDNEYNNILLAHTWAVQNLDRIQEALEISSDLPNAGARILELRLSADLRVKWREVALASARRLNNVRREGAHLNALGNAYRELGQLELARKAYDQRIKMHFEQGETGRAIALNNLGLVLADLGQVRDAHSLYSEALRIGQELNSRWLQSDALGNLGNIHMDLNDVHQAIENYEQALAIDSDPDRGDRRRESIDLGNLGYAYVIEGDHEKGMKYIDRSLEIARQLNDRLSEGTSLGHLGRVHFIQGNMKQAIHAYEQQLRISRETGHRKDEAEALANLGEIFESQGKLEQAIQYYLEALEIDVKMGNKQNQAMHSWNMGWIYVKMGEVDKAPPLLQLRLDYDSKISHPDTLSHLAKVEELQRKTLG